MYSELQWCSFLKLETNKVNYELQVNALCLSLFYRHCSLCLSRGYFCYVLPEPNVNLMLKSMFYKLVLFSVELSCIFCANCFWTMSVTSHVWSFIYSLVSLPFRGIITNSQRDQLPYSFIAQLVEQVGHVFESRTSLNQFFQAIISQMFDDDQSCLHICIRGLNMWFFKYIHLHVKFLVSQLWATMPISLSVIQWHMHKLNI